MSAWLNVAPSAPLERAQFRAAPSPAGGSLDFRRDNAQLCAHLQRRANEACVRQASQPASLLARLCRRGQASWAAGGGRARLRAGKLRGDFQQNVRLFLCSSLLKQSLCKQEKSLGFSAHQSKSQPEFASTLTLSNATHSRAGRIFSSQQMQPTSRIDGQLNSEQVFPLEWETKI